MGKKNNRTRSDRLKDSWGNLSDIEGGYEDTYDDSLLNNLIPPMKEPLSIEEDVVFESLGKENLISIEASDCVDDGNFENEINLISEELHKKSSEQFDSKSIVSSTISLNEPSCS